MTKLDAYKALMYFRNSCSTLVKIVHVAGASVQLRASTATARSHPKESAELDRSPDKITGCQGNFMLVRT